MVLFGLLLIGLLQSVRLCEDGKPYSALGGIFFYITKLPSMFVHVCHSSVIMITLLTNTIYQKYGSQTFIPIFSLYLPDVGAVIIRREVTSSKSLLFCSFYAKLSVKTFLSQHGDPAPKATDSFYQTDL